MLKPEDLNDLVNKGIESLIGEISAWISHNKYEVALKVKAGQRIFVPLSRPVHDGEKFALNNRLMGYNWVIADYVSNEDQSGIYITEFANWQDH